MALALTNNTQKWLFLFRCVLQVALAFGVHVTGEQQAAITLLVEGALAVFTDKVTTPNASLHPETVVAAKAGLQP